MKASNSTESCCQNGKCSPSHPCQNPVYVMGVIGSLIFHFQHVTNFTDVLMGIFKSIAWPGYLAYYFFSQLK